MPPTAAPPSRANCSIKARVGHGLDEQRPDAFRLHLIDQSAEAGGRRFAFGAEADRSEEGYAIGLAEIAERIVRRMILRFAAGT